MRLLVADKMNLSALEELRILGIEVIYRPELTRDTLAAALDGISILVVRSTEVTGAALSTAKHLNLIVRAGAGVNTIDVAAASARGIYVANCPGKNAIAVAELAMGLILALDRKVVDATTDLRAGRWEKSKYSSGGGLFGRRLGIAGLGAVGRELLDRARAFGLTPHAWSRSLTPTRAAKMDVGFSKTLEELAAKSDILSIHLPLTAHTRGVVSRRVLEALPDGAILVNTSRFEVLDYVALAELVPRKNLRVGLDVLPGEPDEGKGTIDPSLFEQGLVYGTPHIGASTEQAQLAIALETARIVRSFLTEEDVPNVVNIAAASPARFAVVIRMMDKVGVLANCLAVLKRHNINVEEVSNTVFEGALATCTKLRVSGRPSDACVKEIQAFDEVLHVDVIGLPNLA
ncbi:NAD(P)-dependent oxidoreductase [Chondromyces apiculatus]|uniref:D-3-phosphoglycerate dehydrogenase n=1 Tax=Chondromyces apiculatus DSM 436 TaxID=1192034 RepID=A0A017SZQ7_9BACT|nr:NAD(P)-dependent oxidoreductase [Chondromyces apiculatus]EYF02252.1 D-3-phosphoglycerate dehydrogenase [Chondromyces apiculatus DSM 436]